MIRKAFAVAALTVAALGLGACGVSAPSEPVQQKAGATELPTATKAAGKLSVSETGYGVTRSHDASLSDFAWAASIVKNTTGNVIAFSVSFSAYTGGTVIGQASSNGIVGSGKSAAAGAQIEIPSDAKITKVVATLSTLDSEKDTHPNSRFEAVGVHFQPGTYDAGKVLGEVRSRYVQDVTNVQVEVVCYGKDGRINGGGEAYVDAIGHGQTVGFSVDLLTVTGTPARCAAYPMVSVLSSGS